MSEEKEGTEEKMTVLEQLNACVKGRDFEGAYTIVRENMAQDTKKGGLSDVAPAIIGDALKQAATDRTILSFVESVGFGAMPLAVSLDKLDRLLSFNAKLPGTCGALVLNDTWGLGIVKRIDNFYRRITVDFRMKKGHQFSYAAACDMLVAAPDDHILVMREKDPQGFETLLRERKGEFIVAVIKSNGKSMTVTRLEDYCVRNGFVKAVNWKAFWNSARTELRQNKLVIIPAKKTEPIEIREKAEDYGDTWLELFTKEKDPKIILADVRDFDVQGKFKGASEKVREKIGERLSFAVTAVRNVDNALYARLACKTVQLGFLTPPAEKMRAYLWDRKRFVDAARELPAREVSDMVRFLAADDDACERLYAAIPELCYTAVEAIIENFKDRTKVISGAAGEETVYPCRQAIARFMSQPKAPATLTTILVGHYANFKDWKELPSLVSLLMHAIALGEGRQSGETLKMQNIIRRLFANNTWLKQMFETLTPEARVLFFERFQASVAWDPSMHHAIVVRMARLAPDELNAHIVKPEKKREYARITSPRSFALRKAEYLKLINEDMPANVKRIEFAKSYGDLSENAEYQYAKDEQRALMQKQTLMQAELEEVKAGDFANATTDEVMPGVTVVVETTEGIKTYTILGEWDNDLERGILSSKTRVAQNLFGKKAGDSCELPDANGNNSFATVREIKPLDDAIRAWMQIPAGLQI